ncbi:uncharacterized protein LOC134753778 [Cydia strobilella]|uniref:uncharacterized protein LOC134753778 n=1 Tax=Cydia strobilella TaxID=1100964 RepID=UPI00300427F6
MALYGAPVWAHRINSKNKALLRRPQRVVAIRMIRGYVTVSWTAACALAGTLPWELEAQVNADAHRERARCRALNEFPAPEELRRARQQAHERMQQRWKEDLENCRYGAHTIAALLPSFSPSWSGWGDPMGP